MREIERRIQQVEARNSSGEVRELPEAPAGVPDSYSEHVHLMMDLQVLGLETDMTRVFSFYMSRDSSARVFPESGSETPFHPASHHGNVEENILDFAKINAYHVGMLKYQLEKLESVEEGDGNLLEKTMVIYGSPHGRPERAQPQARPVAGDGGRERTAQGWCAPDGTRRDPDRKRHAGAPPQVGAGRCRELRGQHGRVRVGSAGNDGLKGLGGMIIPTPRGAWQRRFR